MQKIDPFFVSPCSRRVLQGALKLRRGVASALLALSTLVAAGSTPVSAKSPFDGAWTVLVITEKGKCDRAYQYQVRIADGVVVYAGAEPGVSASGRVNANGAVSVKVGRGEQSATGAGRLSGNAGRGGWRGGECAGRWSAERRG